MYNKVTEADIVQYEESYRGGKDEEADLVAFYTKHSVSAYTYVTKYQVECVCAGM
jgi:hypothetical protein